MSSKPEFIIVPGAWHSPEAFDPTTKLLEKAGYTVHGIALPSVGANPPARSFGTDVEAVQSKVDSLIASGKDVVMVYHSYGSVPGHEALSDYLRWLEHPRGQKDRRGKVRRLVFVSSFILPEGGSLMGVLQGQPLPWFQVNGDEVTPADPASIFYNDLDKDTAEKCVSSLKHHSYLTFSSKVTIAPWKVIPSTYIVCEQDMAIPLEAQEGMIGMAQSMAPSSFDVIEKCNAGHSPFISQPEWLAEKLIKAAS